MLGPNAEFFDVRLLNQYLHEMVTMSSLQNSQFETLEPPENAVEIDIAPPPDEIAANIRRKLGL